MIADATDERHGSNPLSDPNDRSEPRVGLPNLNQSEMITDQTDEAEVGAVVRLLHPAAEWIVARLDSQCVSLNHSRSKDARDAKNCYRKAHGNSDESSKHRSKSTL